MIGLESQHVELRYYVRIQLGIKPIIEQVYFRNNMLPDFFFRWLWYFEYLAAKHKVKNPKLKVYFESGAYEYILPEDDYAKKLRNLEIKRKAQLTQFQNKLTILRKNWNELFPLEENPHYQIIVKKLAKLKQDYDIIIFKKQELSNGYKPSEILTYSELLKIKP